jgi:hypothetical protein
MTADCSRGLAGPMWGDVLGVAAFLVAAWFLARAMAG